MSRIDTASADRAAASIATLRDMVRGALGVDESPLAADETPKRMIVVTEGRLLIATTGWMMGTSLNVHAIDRMDAVSVSRDGRGVSMIQLHVGTKTHIVTRGASRDLDQIADALARVVGRRDAR